MILVTGGLGYIGTHVCLELVKEGYEVIIFDNLHNSSPEAFYVLKEATAEYDGNLFLEIGDIRNKDILSFMFLKYNISKVIHLAGLKSVNDSEDNPDQYEDVNVNGSKVLFDVMNEYNCKHLMFASSASVYGDHGDHAVIETDKTNPMSNYARNKLDIENLILNNDSISGIILRIFNPIGTDKERLIGSKLDFGSSNIMPKILELEPDDTFVVYGDKHKTADGSCVRDYVHVFDVARAFALSIKYIESLDNDIVFNVGSGVGRSVFELLRLVKEAVGKDIKYIIGDALNGDVDICKCDISKLKHHMEWRPSPNIINYLY